MDTLLEDVGAEDVPYQLHYSAAELRGLMATCMAGPDRKLVIMRDRVAKHLAGGSPVLLREVWSRWVGARKASFLPARASRLSVQGSGEAPWAPSTECG